MTPSVVVPLVVPRPAPPAARPPPPPPPPLPHSPAYSAEGSQQYFAERGRGRGGRGGYERGGGRGGRGAAPFSPLGSTDEGGFEYEPHPHGYSGGGGEGRGRGRGRGRFSPELSSSGVVGGGRFEGRGRGGGGRGRGDFDGGRGSGGRFSERGGRRGGGRGGFAERGGRGGGGRGGRGGGGAGGSELEVASAVSRLFHGEVNQGAEQPMWRYFDPEGNMQGPFPAKDMETWFQEGYLANPGLKVCGTERKVAPPNLPPPEFFIPLGALIYWVRRGHKFSPITVADVMAKRLPVELQKLKDGAEKVSAPGKEEDDTKGEEENVAGSTADSAGGVAEEERGPEEETSGEAVVDAQEVNTDVAPAVEETPEEDEDIQKLAAHMAELAVKHAIEENED